MDLHMCEIKALYAYSVENNPDPGPELWVQLKRNEKLYKVPIDLDTVNELWTAFDTLEHASKVLLGQDAIGLVMELEDGTFQEVGGQTFYDP